MSLTLTLLPAAIALSTSLTSSAVGILTSLELKDGCPNLPAVDTVFLDSAMLLQTPTPPHVHASTHDSRPWSFWQVSYELISLLQITTHSPLSPHTLSHRKKPFLWTLSFAWRDCITARGNIYLEALREAVLQMWAEVA